MLGLANVRQYDFALALSDSLVFLSGYFGPFSGELADAWARLRSVYLDIWEEAGATRCAV